MKIIEKIKLWMSVITTGQIYKKDPTHSVDHCLSWLLTHKVFDIKYRVYDYNSNCDYKLCEYNEIGDHTPYSVYILFGDDDTDQKYVLKLWNVNRWYAFAKEGSVSFWSEYSNDDCKPCLICDWKDCVPKKSIVYKLAKLMIEWEENKSKSTDKPGVNEN